jgi:hypothetical protein
MLAPIVDRADDPPVVIDLSQESEVGKDFGFFGFRLILMVVFVENEVPIPIPAPVVVSGQRTKCSAGPLGKSTNVKVSHLRLTGLSCVKDRFIQWRCVPRPAARIRPSSGYSGVTGFPSSDSEVDGARSSDGGILRESPSPSAGHSDLQGSAGYCEHERLGWCSGC